MAIIQLSDRLRTALMELRAVESTLEATLGDLSSVVRQHPVAPGLLADIQCQARDHIAAIEARLRNAGDDRAFLPADGMSVYADRGWLSDLHPVSSSLRIAYTLINEAMIGYSMILPISFRFRDSWVIADEGTTAHLARQHTQDYVAAAGRIVQLIHDAVIWELDAEGLSCQCTCPSCGIGICVGAESCRSIVAQAQSEALPVEARQGVYVHPPRHTSAAAEAGLQAGDVILAVDGTRIDSLPRLKTAVRDHGPGDQIRFKVQRGAEELAIEVLRNFDQHDERTKDSDECIQAAGEDFTQARAVEAHRQLRNGDSLNDSDGGGLATLTAREIQILRLLAEGASNSMIAAELVISRATVARHVANILSKLRLANRTEAATLAAKAGLLSRV